jgi:hypothetical protein
MGGRPVDLIGSPSARRTVYGFIDRMNLPGLLRTFDFPNPDLSSPQRFTTTVPQQALFLLNNPLLLEESRHLVGRLGTRAGESPTARIERLYRLVYGRPPLLEEVIFARQFLAGAPTEDAAGSATAWHYGYGEYDEAARQLECFHPCRQWTGTSWQADGVALTADGGHPGSDARHAAVRRWTAPCDCVVKVTGTLEHQAEPGIRARVVSSRHREVGRWDVHKGKADTHCAPLAVRAGDALDFIVAGQKSGEHEEFKWTPTVQRIDESADATIWSAAHDFRGPALTPWEQFAQVLLLANEFAFVD